MIDRKKPGLAFWASAVLVAVLVGYPLSFGPACWVTSWTDCGASAIPIIYKPIVRLFWTENRTFKSIVVKYSAFAAAPRWSWKKYLNKDGDDWEFICGTGQ
jgi:hypothetical protein